MMRRAAWTLASIVALAASPAFAEQAVKRNVWSFGVTGARHNLKAGNGTDELLGNSAAIQIGTGSVSKSWYSVVSLDILLGPYEPGLGDQLNVDYQGTGFTAWTGFSAQTLDLRSEAGGYGFALGLSYADIVGRSIGANRKDTGETTPENGERFNSYVMRITNFSMLPGIFFSWLSPARPEGNSPELLATRTEGYLLTLGVAVPLLVTYNAKYERLNNEDGTETGQLRGYSVLMTLTAMLGT